MAVVQNLQAEDSKITERIRADIRAKSAESAFGVEPGAVDGGAKVSKASGDDSRVRFAVPALILMIIIISVIVTLLF